MEDSSYIAIDLKSFYASCECVERGLDPLTTNLVVADSSRTEKTICLAVSPSLKAVGVPGRPRLFEVNSIVRQINESRRWCAPGRRLSGFSASAPLLAENPSLGLDFIVATPRMALYMEYSTRIYSVYLKYFAPEDIHVYSIDEVFIDITPYRRLYRSSAADLAADVVRDVLRTTGITATVGIGSNMYLAKVAMDIVAKRIAPDKNGVRIAALDEMSYRRLLWDHRPLTDFWRVGSGYERKLAAYGIHTMGDIALMSECNERLLYDLFGVNAELLIDHAWGYEPCTMKHVKAYRPRSKSLSSGQVLHCSYDFDRARIVAEEMCDALVLDMVEKGLVASLFTLSVGYESIDPASASYKGELCKDYYGRIVPKPAHGTANLHIPTSSTSSVVQAVLLLFDRIVDRSLSIRKINICAGGIMSESELARADSCRQLDFFTDYEAEEKQRKALSDEYKREKQRQKAVIDIKNKFGKNAILKAISFEEGATAIDRNMQIGGHKA